MEPWADTSGTAVRALHGRRADKLKKSGLLSHQDVDAQAIGDTLLNDIPSAQIAKMKPGDIVVVTGKIEAFDEGGWHSSTMKLNGEDRQVSNHRIYLKDAVILQR